MIHRRKRFTWLVIGFVLLPGCVLYVHDAKIRDLKPADVNLSDFVGVYDDSANYHTPPNRLGLEGHETLGSAPAGLYFKSDVTVEVTASGDIDVKADGGAFGPIALHYVKGRDFEFKDHEIVFTPHRTTGTSEVAIGTIKSSMIWLLDEAKELVVISRSGGGGLAGGVLPMVSSGATLSTFARKPNEANPSPEAKHE